jgi:ABC-type Fe3+/spermidine/putrescine transport system ATPase subunit
MLRLSDVSVSLGGFRLQVESLQVGRGEYLVILGPNGAGKTVLLETIAGLHPLDGGQIELCEPGEERRDPAERLRIPAEWLDISAWPPEKRRVGFVYQDYLLFPHLSVAGNIGFGLRGRMPARSRAAQVRDTAALTGVEDLLGRRTVGLSGGEQQKVALARALAIRPHLLLLDEPLAALDRRARREMATDVKRLCTELSMTVLHVTHSLEEAVTLGDRIAVLAEGRLLQVASPTELLRAPANEQVADLVGCENLLAGKATGSSVAIARGPTLETAATEPGDVTLALPAEDVTLALRAEDLTLDLPLASEQAQPETNRFAAVVEAVEPGAAHWTVRVRYAGETFPAAGTRAAAGISEAAAEGATFKVFVLPPEVARLGLAAGSLVRVSVDPGRVHVCGPVARP